MHVQVIETRLSFPPPQLIESLGMRLEFDLLGLRRGELLQVMINGGI